MKIIAIEQNYNEHNKEENIAFKKSETPIVYSKTDSSLLKDGKPFFIPDFTSDCRAELQLVIRICRLGKCISKKFAHRYYDATTIGINFFAADKLEECKQNGKPWELYQGFDGAAAIGSFEDITSLKENSEISLNIDNNKCQQGSLNNMIWNIDELIEYISQFYTLRQGDLIFTGCPNMAQKVVINEHIEGFLDKKRLLDFNIK